MNLEEEAQRAFDNRDLWYKVNVQESVFKAGYKDGVKSREKQLVKLEKENAKAKKLIKDLLGSENTSCEEEMYFEIRHKAEAFIKE